jgi:hypothetical protein
MKGSAVLNLIFAGKDVRENVFLKGTLLNCGKSMAAVWQSADSWNEELSSACRTYVSEFYRNSVWD